MSRSRRRSLLRWRLIAAAAVAVTLGLAVTATAGATLYTAKISPTAAEAGSSDTYTVTLRNLLGPRMGSANVQIPAGWTDASVETLTVLKPGGAASDRVWTAQLDGSTLELRADGTGNANKVPILWSVEVSVTATAPCAEGVSTWETAAKTGSDFTGHSFFRIGPKPKVTVAGSCAHHLDIDQQPTQTVVGEAIDPAVTVLVENAAGDQVDYDGPVSLTLSGPGSFTGDSTTTVNAVDGLATFSNLKVDTVGAGYTLEATSGSLLPDTSDPFDIVFAKTVLETTAGTSTSGTNCSETGDATNGVPSCVEVLLPNGANGQISLVTGTPDLQPPPPEGTDDVIDSILGDFKDGEGQPLYDQDDPATAVLEYDESTLPDEGDCMSPSELSDYWHEDYYISRPDELLFKEPRTCLELFAQFSEGGAWHPVPVCEERDEGPSSWHSYPGTDEYLWSESLFDDNDDDSIDSGACMVASHFDEEGDLVLYVLFFADPHFGKR